MLKIPVGGLQGCYHHTPTQHESGHDSVRMSTEERCDFIDCRFKTSATDLGAAWKPGGDRSR
jgi:hypothetical protein